MGARGEKMEERRAGGSKRNGRTNPVPRSLSLGILPMGKTDEINLSQEE